MGVSMGGDVGGEMDWMVTGGLGEIDTALGQLYAAAESGTVVLVLTQADVAALVQLTSRRQR